MTAAIDIHELCKTYPRNWASPPVEALKSISLSIAEGEVFGFIGPNGAGKSTAIKILTGVISASAGSASLFGVDVTLPQARRGLGYVPENPSLPDYLNPMEILSMGLALQGRKHTDSRRHSLRWLERFGLGQAAFKVVRGFSKGMAQRTALAHALAVEPRLLILDEPLSGLDPVGRKDVMDILIEYRKTGGAIFFTSHVLHDVERIADRFGMIHQGQLKTVKSPSELAGGDQVITVRTLGVTPVAGMRSDAGNRWYGEVRGSELWPLLHRIELAGHVLVEVKPELTLESAFMQIVRATP